MQLPKIRAAIEFQRDQPARAVELPIPTSHYERAYPEAVYLQGPYLRLHKGAEAAADFQKSLITLNGHYNNSCFWISVEGSQLIVLSIRLRINSCNTKQAPTPIGRSR